MLTQLAQQILWQMGALLLSPVFWLAVALVYLQARRRAKMQQEMFQLRREPVAATVAVTVAAGFAGGLLASILLLLLGVSVEQIGLGYLWIVALLLLLLRQRFLCFAYSGGLLAASNFLLGWPVLDGAQLLAMVAVLHGTEAFLVLTTGHRNSLPIYLRQGQQIGGGFLLQLVWPLPLVMLAGPAGAVPQAGFLLMPDWWPVLGQAGALYWLTPVVAALGYSDLAAGCDLRRKTARSAFLLLLYSLCLLALVFWGQRHDLLLIPALFAPLGHEAVIFFGRWRASREQALQGPDRGATVLAVQKGSPAARAGLRGGDWIMQLNGETVADRQDFLRRQYGLPAKTTVTYLQRGRRRQSVMVMGRWSQPGIITAPDGRNALYWETGKDEGAAVLLWKKWKQRRKRRGGRKTMGR